MKIRHRPNLSSLGVAFFATLLGHGLILLYLSVFNQPPPSPPATPQSEVIPLLSKQQVEQLLKRSKITSPSPQEKKKKEKQKDQQPNRGQIVEIPPPEQERKPKDARFLSEFNSAVEREMVHANAVSPQPKMMRSDRRSMSGGDDEKGSRKGRRGVKNSEQRSTKSNKDTQKKASRKKQAQSNVKSIQKQQQQKVVTEGEGPFKRTKTEQQRSNAEQVHQTSPHTSSHLGRLAPTHYQSLLPTLGPQNLERLEGSIDHVLNVPKGRKTALNTREYRFAHFFNRVKREVSARWRAVDLYRARDPHGEVYGVQDRQTVLSVTLDEAGSLASVKVLQSSGIRALDLEAIEAFKRAQPFYNPPKGLADPDGKIRFKFGFFLEINGGGFRFLP